MPIVGRDRRRFAFCIIDAKPSGVFEAPGPLAMAVTAASSLRRSAMSVAQGDGLSKEVSFEVDLKLLRSLK